MTLWKTKAMPYALWTSLPNCQPSALICNTAGLCACCHVHVSGRPIHTPACDTVVCMAQVDRFSVTMPPELGEGVRQAAARQGTSVSTWLTEAAADKLRNELLGTALDQWESEDGAFTQAELEEAAARLGLAPRTDAA
jgi:hypothetical protein